MEAIAIGVAVAAFIAMVIIASPAFEPPKFDE